MNTSPVIVLLGSNIAPEINLPRAFRLLAERAVISAVSCVYESAPLDAAGQMIPDQGVFWNAAARIATGLPPAVLKRDVLRPIEARLGRVRTADRFAPRPIDLDVVLYGGLVLDDPRLPDPGILTRAYVALPLADLIPTFTHPITGQTLAAIAAKFAGAPGIAVRTGVSLSDGYIPDSGPDRFSSEQGLPRPG
jgi:2-amino-4-hydroxy-6-hydroxymethyldihydropteridine diphosphokinase